MVEAVRHFRLSAEQGYARGQLNLGRMYELGAGGVQRDYTQVPNSYMLPRFNCPRAYPCSAERRKCRTASTISWPTPEPSSKRTPRLFCAAAFPASAARRNHL